MNDDKTNPTKTSRAGDAKKNNRDMSDSDLGQALRSVYQGAVSEEIPSEMLDLLGRLD